MKIYRFSLEKKGLWLAVDDGLRRLEPYRPHVIKLRMGSVGVLGRTPFEAMYRAQRYMKELA